MGDMIVSDELLAKLGFKAAADKIKKLRDKKRKLLLAHEIYKIVKPEHVQRFSEELRQKTHNWDNRGGYHVLDFTPISAYEGVPPAEVLTALEEAHAHKCFDSYEVAYIKKVDDPLLFGRIDGCADRFFISQWDNDVKITDILKDNEG